MKCNIPKEFCNVRNEDGTCAINQRCEPVIDRCKEGQGCAKIENGYCRAYIRPESKWRLSKVCPAATHIKSEAEKLREKRRIGQQKQRKRR